MWSNKNLLVAYIFMVHKCMYRGRKEKCLIGSKYPITKDNKISEKRIKAAESYGSQEGVLAKLKRAGLCKLARNKGIKLKSCMK